MRDAILRLLETLPPDRKVEDRGDSAWLCCPIHANGQEKTQSFKINLTEYLGSFYCFGCGEYGPWRKTVQVLGFEASARFMGQRDPSEIFSDDDEAAMLKGVHKKNNTRGGEFRERWPLHETWRNVPGKLIQDVGGTMILGGNNREPCLRLSVLVRGKEKGFIDCRIVKKEGETSYLNSSNSRGWAKDVIYPYDFVKELEPEVLAMVEGPRDALINIRNGLPSLAILGATSWSAKCVALVKSINPKVLLLMLDPDGPGDGATRRIYKDLRDSMQVIPISLPSKIVDGKKKKLVDPADLNRKKLLKVCALAGITLPDVSALEKYRRV